APPERTALRRAYHILYLTRPALPLSAALAWVEAELGAFAAIRELLAFARESKRGICRARGHADGSGADGGHEAAA
ncbi:MAG: acyl-ACP--UDP-N-acetylglucosamine O-acyltransferase, partial [Gemmata sp.]